MQHAHILAPPTRTAGWYLCVRQSETVYHLRTITTSIAREKFLLGRDSNPHCCLPISRYPRDSNFYI
ncbi:unnamed protein product [Acanthoscelides obtectus]|uniref:Uncharacterized protein n=1 Tax=Acanthoscelides obtectus TaxID=200917 RepID=A0A9P0LXX7_ACAOB|nr:unnamed protein product [Acanthoscelides obtectus]CAK1670763.1 hypothetical protein AOBTE_LOCUS27812 [Acanthoscelides obtectus]